MSTDSHAESQEKHDTNDPTYGAEKNGSLRKRKYMLRARTGALRAEAMLAPESDPDWSPLSSSSRSLRKRRARTHLGSQDCRSTESMGHLGRGGIHHWNAWLATMQRVFSVGMSFSLYKDLGVVTVFGLSLVVRISVVKCFQGLLHCYRRHLDVSLMLLHAPEYVRY